MAYPIFTKNGVPFQLVTRDGAMTYDVVVVTCIGGVQLGWGGTDDERSVIIEDVDDAKILAHGSLHDFIAWANGEAERRAEIHSKTFLPDPNDRLARLVWNLQHSNSVSPDGSRLIVANPPLP